jgi:hypothetical protein
VTTPPSNAQPLAPEVQAAIDAAVAQMAQQYEDRIKALENENETLRGSQLAPSPITEHAGGVGTSIAPTWSQYEQELARYGAHPDQSAA